MSAIKSNLISLFLVLKQMSQSKAAVCSAIDRKMEKSAFADRCEVFGVCKTVGILLRDQLQCLTQLEHGGKFMLAGSKAGTVSLHEFWEG